MLQYLAPPHVILRHGMIQGNIYPLLADHLAHFLAATLFHTSLLAVSTEHHRWAARVWGPFRCWTALLNTCQCLLGATLFARCLQQTG